MTLNSLHAQDMDLRVFCSVCGHFAVVPSGMLISKLGGSRPFQDAKHHLRCQKCRAYNDEGWEITVMPDWHIGRMEGGPFAPEAIKLATIDEQSKLLPNQLPKAIS